MIFRENWGIKEFDARVGGLPMGTMSVVESPDNRTGMMLLGQYLDEGLKQGERCVLVTFESPVALFDNFEKSQMNFSPYLDSEQFIYLQYKTSVTSEIGLSYRYTPLFEEVHFLAREVPHRIAIHQVDALFSLHNVALINNCAQKLIAAANQFGTTVLGQFIQFNDQIHRDLSIACRKTMSGCFALEPGAAPHRYNLQTYRVPWYQYDDRPVALTLQEGRGFVSDSEIVRERKAG